jgi:type IV secretion system protein TrbB
MLGVELCPVSHQPDRSMNDLVRLSLRMRPDRILVGEVRGHEALDLLMAWNTGHEGGIATLPPEWR